LPCITTAAALLLFAAPGASALAPGAPDPSFGASGVITPTGLRVGQVLPQRDGSMLVLGLRGINTPWRTVLQRRLPDGSQDRTFGGTGEVFIETPRAIGPAAFTQAWQYDDGRLLVMGWTSVVSSVDLLDAWEDRVVIGRLLPDGRPDPTFSRDGFLSIDAAVGGPEEEVIPEIRPIVDTSDPSRLGFEITTSASTALTAFDGAGRLDTGFAEDGTLVVDVAAYERRRGASGTYGGNALGWRMAADGRWLLAARSWRGSGPTAERWQHLHRYTAAGVLDAAFGTDGTAIVTDPGASRRGEWYDGFPADLIALRDGGLVTIEEAADDGSTTLTRWRADGTLDASWSGDGQSELDVQSIDGGSLSVSDAEEDAAGRIVLSLSAWRTDDARFLRLTSTGDIDTTFDADGAWLPLARATVETSEFAPELAAPFTLDARGRVVWWADLGTLGCCPWRGRISSRIGVLAAADAPRVDATLQLAIRARRCGASRARACVVTTTGGVVVEGQLAPVPPLGQRVVYVSLFDCEGGRHFVGGVRVGDDGRFTRVLGAARDGDRWRVVARREPWGDQADVVSRAMHLRLPRTGRCEL